MRTVAIIQARMGSSRLPGKVLEEIAGEPMLWHVVERTRCARRVDEVVVATTDRPEDDAVAAYCDERGIACMRGDAEDVLDRYFRAARTAGADVVVRMTADCPLADPALIDSMLERFAATGCDYLSNTQRYTYPLGLDVEVFGIAVLERSWREARSPSEREHVTPYMKTAARFTRHSFERAEAGPELRLTVDYPEDLEYIRRLFAHFAGQATFGLDEIEAAVAQDPSLRRSEAPEEPHAGYYRSLYGEAAAAETTAAPARLVAGRGYRVRDSEGRTYTDFAQSLGPDLLGYGVLDDAPEGERAELGSRLRGLVPGCEYAHVLPSPDAARALAVAIAREATGRDPLVVDPVLCADDLGELRAKTSAYGALLVFDERRCGFRLAAGGAQQHYDVSADLVCIGSELGHGHSMGCLCGSARLLAHAEPAQHAPAAAVGRALAALDALSDGSVRGWLRELGSRLRDGFNVMARESGLAARCHAAGPSAVPRLEIPSSWRDPMRGAACSNGLLLDVTHTLTAAHDHAAIDQVLSFHASFLKRVVSMPETGPEPSAQVQL